MALKAIREDDISAASHGINVLKYKVMAFAIAAFMAGVAGAVYGYYLFHLEPASVFNMNWLFYPILMVVLGRNGYHHRSGHRVVDRERPVRVWRHLSSGATTPSSSGLLIILVMRFMPAGLMGLFSMAPRIWHKSPDEQDPVGGQTEAAG